MWVIQVLWVMKDICVAFFTVAIAQVLFIDIKMTAYSMQTDLKEHYSTTRLIIITKYIATLYSQHQDTNSDYMHNKNQNYVRSL